MTARLFAASSATDTDFMVKVLDVWPNGFVQRLNEKDLKFLTTDRNAKEGLRLLAKKMLSKGKV